MKKKNFFTDSFGNITIIKRFVILVFGVLTYRRYNVINQLEVKGTENLDGLPKNNLLFVSNHHTYFADVIAVKHVISNYKNGIQNSSKHFWTRLNPMTNFYYIAALETMKDSFLTKVMAYTGAVSIKRTWREAGKEVSRKVDMKDVDSIKLALEDGWVITFPQGTTRNFAPGRKGTAHLIKNYKPVVVPVVVEGFRECFDKKGLKIENKGSKLKITFKSPLDIDFDAEKEVIIGQVMDAIEQSDKFKPADFVEPEQQKKKEETNA